MILLDSNILIYLRHPEWGEQIATKLAGQRLATCNVIVAEVLGYRGLSDEDARYFADLLASMKNLPFDDAVTAKVIDIRRRTAIQLPDSIIAATALAHDLELYTHNTADFARVAGLRLVDPLGGPLGDLLYNPAA